jgi:triacylglycerol esterase/lipase EstA (alpha/beta hydrolase family)
MMATPMRTRSPVVLVHGFKDSGRKMEPMTRFLRRRGWEAQTVTLAPSWGEMGIDELAGQLAETLDTRFAPEQRVNLVGFSMGGLICRYYAQRLGGLERIDRLVTIACPHRGTLMAHASKRPGPLQMRPNSEFLRDLNRDIEELGRVKFSSVWTPLDLMIVPANSSRIGVGEERVHWVVAHPLMVYQPSVMRTVAEILGV